MISSHILTELSLVATKYGIISHGTLIKELSADELNTVSLPNTVIEVSSPEALYEVLSAIVPREDMTLLDGGVSISGHINLTQILNAVLAAKIEILSVNCNKSSIESYYMSLMGGGKNA